MVKERPTITRYICPVFNTKLEDELEPRIWREHENQTQIWQILESDREIKMTKINILNNGKQNMQEQMHNVSIKIETLRQDQREVLEIKNTVKWRNAFDALSNSFHMAGERISELESRSIETSQTGIQRDKYMNKREHPRTVELYQKV